MGYRMLACTVELTYDIVRDILVSSSVSLFLLMAAIFSSVERETYGTNDAANRSRN